MSSPYIDETQTIIVVMGTTGVGKSTFINYATNGSAKIGRNLTACRCPVKDIKTEINSS
jgi:polynucleotide 5'-kinase involved in rRNA processing